MAIQAKIFQIIMLFTLLFNSSVYAEQSLTIESAVKVALERDAMINVYQFRRDALLEQSISEDTLPDPKIKIGIMNVPTDTYAMDQEPMTQVQLGIQQMFPRGNSLEIKSQRTKSMSAAENAKTENQRRIIMREVRQIWLELFYWLKAESVVNANYNLFKKLVSVTKQQYAAGRQKQQDVIRSELELGLLDDRKLKIKIRIEAARAKLEKYIGQEQSRLELSKILPSYQFNKNNNVWLKNHPVIYMEQALVKINEKNVELSKQDYKPSWMLDLTYGRREDRPDGVERSDFVSAMLMFDMPLFTSNKQDKTLAASKLRLNSAKSSELERKRNLLGIWKEKLSNEKLLSLRSKKYKTLLVPKASENTKAALYSYQSGQSAFTALMRAQIIELETQLRALRLDVDHKKIQAQLLYFVGEV